MILWHDPAEVPGDFGPTVVAIGKFDGVHAGHRAIIERMLVDAVDGVRAVAVTFDRNPLAVLAPEKCPPSLVGVQQKAALLAETGLDATLMLPFDRRLADEEPEAFALRVLVHALRARRVLVGADFRFGHRGAGDVALLRRMGERHGFAVEVVADVVASGGGRRVSSTWIRELLDAGDVDTATRLLGRPPAVRGEVVHGRKRGRELGFPTANLGGEIEGFVPADGVYAGWLIDLSGDRVSQPVTHLPAAISIGTNPTFDDVLARQVEAFVLNQDDLDLYGHRVEVRFAHRVRGMVAYTGVEALVAQMTDDVARVAEMLR